MARTCAFFCVSTFCLSTLLVFALGDHFFTPEFLTRIKDRYGDNARHRIEAWQLMLEKTAGLETNTQLAQVNSFFNRLTYKSDMVVWGQQDYWATPVELLAVNSGDCDDFAIAKYFSLRMIGIPDDQLRLTYVRHYFMKKTLKVTPHLVLVYYADTPPDPLVLDNLIPEIKPASQRHDLVPVYSFNAGGLWRALERNRGRQTGKTGRFLKWEDVMNRMKTDLPKVIRKDVP